MPLSPPRPTVPRVRLAPRMSPALQLQNLAPELVEELIDATDKTFCEDEAPPTRRSGVHVRAHVRGAPSTDIPISFPKRPAVLPRTSILNGTPATAPTRFAKVVIAMDGQGSAPPVEVHRRRRFIGTAPTIMVIGPTPGRPSSELPVVLELDSDELVDGWEE
jgi:hypothetical protein